MKICAIDVGKKGAITVYDNETEEYLVKEPVQFISFLDLRDVLLKLCTNKWVDVFVIGEAFGHRAVVKYQAKYYGIVELMSEEFDLPLFYVSDRTARAKVLGFGYGNKKKEVHKKYKAETPDVSDCMLFTDWFLKYQK